MQKTLIQIEIISQGLWKEDITFRIELNNGQNFEKYGWLDKDILVS